jgi:hypothetical protein
MAWNCKHSENKMKKLAQTALAGYTLNEGMFFSRWIGVHGGQLKRPPTTRRRSGKTAKNSLRL